MSYNLDDFINACADPNNVSVAHDAGKAAENDFKLLTKTAILAFINTDGLEDPDYINTEAWRLNPNKPPEIYVDAYNFYSGKKYGYIAFMFILSTNKWRIKSFKLNSNPNLRAIKNGFSHLPFKNLIRITGEALKGVSK